jgi:hypothetical protein
MFRQIEERTSKWAVVAGAMIALGAVAAVLLLYPL